MAKSDKTKVTRISASDSKPKAKAVVSSKSTAKVKKPAAGLKKRRSLGPLGSFLGYFKGAWVELRQVHWPTRRATWGLTGAVLLFSLFFVLFITSLDALFKFAFERMLGN